MGQAQSGLSFDGPLARCGIASAPALFQRTIETIFQGIPRIVCYLDDILIIGEDDAEHL